MAQYDVDLRDYWRILKKRKGMVLLMIVLVSGFSFFFAKMREPPPIYQAHAAVKIERRTSMADFFTGGFWFQSDSIGTQAFIIRSFPVLARAAQSLGWVPGDLTPDEIREAEAHMAAVERLRGMVSADQESGANILNIRSVSSTPRQAADVANAVAVTYRDYNVLEKNKQTFETKAFVEEQLAETARQLREAEAALRAFKEDHDVVELDAQTRHTLDRLFELESEHDAVLRQQAILSRQLAALDMPVSGTGSFENLLLPEIEDDKAVQGLNERLRDLVMERQTLLIDFTEEHPKVVELNDRIHGILYGIRKALRSRLVGLQDREAELKTQLASLKRTAGAFPAQALRLNRLQREVTLNEELYSQLKSKYQEIRIQAAGKVEEVTLVRPATVPAFPINIPSKITVMATGVIMGIFMGIVFAFVAETLDTSLGAIEDVESLLQVPVLGIIPFLKWDEAALKNVPDPDRVRDLVAHYEPNSPAAEAFRSIRTNLQFMVRKPGGGRSFLVTSSYLQEGKTFNSMNIAVSLAQSGVRVLLMECDLRNPTVHRAFGLSMAPGLTDYVLGGHTADDVIQTITDVMVGRMDIDEVMMTPGLDNLHYITSGGNIQHPSEILNSPRFKALVDHLKTSYDVLVIDAPPILPVADAVDISPIVDGVILVYTVGKIARGVLKRAKSALDKVNARVLGVVLNNVKPETGPDYFKYQSRYYSREHRGAERRSWGLLRSGAHKTRGKRSSENGRRWGTILLLSILLGLVFLTYAFQAEMAAFFESHLP
jgi:capsular exopolysaccharide synthesis family protein